MDYYEQHNGASGSIPEFGAIFMSNTETQSECFNKKIFALPYSRAEFVKHIKAGMILFLFEYKKRQLFGVYQAFSDGSIDIAPHAFKYSGRHFPAQVCFTRIWHCDPLPEKEFRDAIRENYFSAKKFNFGLSEDQVRRLLYLFSSRKLKTKMPPRPLPETVVEVAGKNRRLVRDDRSEMSEIGYMEPADEFSPVPFFNHSSTRTQEEALVDDGFNTEGQLYPYSEEEFLAEEFLSKKRRLGNNDRSRTNDEAENGIYNRGAVRDIHSDFPKDSLDELERLADSRRLLLVDVVDENQVDRREDLVDPLDAIVNDNYRIMQRRRLIDEYNLQNSSKQTFASDRYDEPLGKFSHAVDGDMFLSDDSTQRDYNPCVTLKPVAYGDSNQSLYRQARELIDDQGSLMNRKSEDRYRLGCDGIPIGAFEHSSSPWHKIRGTATARRLPVNESEPDFCTSVDKISHPLQYGHRTVYDRNYPVAEGRSNENLVNNNFRSTSLAKSDLYVTGVDRRIVDDERFRKSERADNEVDTRMHTNPSMPKEYRSFSQLKQDLSSFPDKLPEKGLSHSISHNFGVSRSTFDDSTITRAVPYSPDHRSYSHRFSASIPANQNPSLVRKDHPDHGLDNFYSPSKRRAPQYFLESEKFSRPVDIAPEFGHKCFPTSTSGYQITLLPEPTSSLPNSNLPVHMDLNTSAPRNYIGSLFPKHSPQRSGIPKSEGEQGLLAYSPKSRENSVHMDRNTSPPANYRGSLHSQLSSRHTVLENYEEQRKFLYPSGSRDNHFVFDRNLTIPSRDTNMHEMDISAGQNYSIRHPERDLACLDKRYFIPSSNMNLQEPCKVSEAPHTNSSVGRISVFSRLTSSKEGSRSGKEGNDTSFSHDDIYMDASADEIMEMLQRGGNPSQIKLSKSRVGEIAVNEKKQENAFKEKKQDNAVKEKKQDNAVREKKQENAVKEKKQENAVREKKPENAVSEKKHENAVSEKKHENAVREKKHENAVREKKQENAVREKKQENAVREKKLENAVREKKQENAVKEKKHENAVKEKKQDNAVNEKKTRNHIEFNHSTTEKNELNDESLSIADGMDEVSTEIRMVNFKRRSERQKTLVGTTADPDTHNTITSAYVEVKNSMKTTSKRRKLVRPSWDKAESAIGTICKNGASKNHPPILGKDDKQSCEAAHQPVDCNKNEHQSQEEEKDVLAICKNGASQNHPPILGKDDKQSCEAADQPVDCNKNEHQSQEEQMDVVAICKNGASQNHPPILGQDDKQSCEAPHQPVDCNKNEHQSREEQKDVVAICKNGASQNHPPILGKDDKQSCEAAHQPVDCNKNEHQSQEEQKDVVAICKNGASQNHPPILGKDDKQSCEAANQPVDCNKNKHQSQEEQKDVVAICKNGASQNHPPFLGKDDKQSCEAAHQPVDCDKNEHQSQEEQKDVEAHVLPSASQYLKGHETATVDLQIASLQALKETTQKSSPIQTSADGILVKNLDTTTTNLNLPESSLDGSRLDAGCANNLVMVKSQKTKKRKKKSKKTLATGM